MPDTRQRNQLLAKQFTEWYYKMINSLHPNSSITPEPFRTEHFYEDCKTDICIQGIVESVQGSQQSCAKLASIVIDRGTLFQPNITNNGLSVISEKHGLIVIHIAGTLHTIKDHIGIFEQQFGLVSDPFNQNNYKIQFTKLKCLSK